MKRRDFLSRSATATAILASSSLFPIAQRKEFQEKATPAKPQQGTSKGSPICQINARFVIGHQDGGHVIYENGCLVYQKDRILFVGHGYKGPVDHHLDAQNAIVSPGFIDLDALGDIDHTFLFVDTPPDMQRHLTWHKEYFPNRKEWMSPEDERFKTWYAFAQLISNGITTAMPITSVYYKRAGETYAEAVAAVENAARLGLRVYLGPSYISAMRTIDNAGNIEISPMHEDGKQGFEAALRFAKEYNGAHNGLVHTAFKPERIEFQTEEILKESKRMARELNCPIRLHAAQGMREYDFIQSRYRKSPIAYLDSIGFLDHKTYIPHTIVSSGNPLLKDQSDDDQKILQRNGSTVIHCPLVFARFGENLNSFGRYRRLGINLAMGTDTFPCDMIENMRLGSFNARHMDADRPENSFAEFFNAATLGGAKALGREDLGRLCAGAKADIVVIDLSGFDTGVIDDPIKTMMLQCSGRDVKTTIIDGRTVMENRIIPGYDYEEAMRKAQAYYEKMKASYGERALNRIPLERLFPPSFPTVKG